MNEILTIVEHQVITISKERSINNEILSYQDRELLFDIVYIDKKGKKRFLFSHNGKNKIKASSIVGSVSLKNGLTIEILPKFAKGKLTETLKKQYRETLINMIRVSNERNFITSQSQNSKISMNEMPLINYIIELFASSLIYTLRQGIYKTYTKKITQTSNIRGNILVSKTIQNSIIDKSKVYCNFNKQSSNNLLMQIFKTLAKLLLQDDNLSYSTKKNLYEIYILLDSVDIINLKPQDFNKIVFNRLNDKYEILFNQAKFIFNKYMPFSSQINATPFWSILFSMDYLFEKFLAYLFKKSNLLFNEQSIIKSFENNSHNMTISAKPDFIIENNLCVVDAKWKLLQKDKTLYGLNAQNFWQLFSYMNLINKDKQLNGYFIVPKNSNEFEDTITFDAIINGNKSITIISIDFSLPFTEIVNNFYFEIENEELKYKKLIKKEKIEKLSNKLIYENNINDKKDKKDITIFNFEDFINELELLSKNKNYLKTITTSNKNKFLNTLKLKNIQNVTTRVFKDFIKSNIDRESLALDNLKIEEIPKNIKKLKKLEIFNIENNHIHILPSELYSLKKLKILNICGNNISKLSKSILDIELKKLYLDISTLNQNKNLIDILINKNKTIVYYPNEDDNNYNEYKSNKNTIIKFTLGNEPIQIIESEENNFEKDKEFNQYNFKQLKDIKDTILLQKIERIKKTNQCYEDNENYLLDLIENNNLEDFQKIILFQRNYDSYIIREKIHEKLLSNTKGNLLAFIKKLNEKDGLRSIGDILEKNYREIEDKGNDWIYALVNIRYKENESIPIIYILTLIAKNTIHKDLIEFLMEKRTEQKILISLLRNFNKDNNSYIIDEKLISRILEYNIKLKNLTITKSILLRENITQEIIEKILNNFKDESLIIILNSTNYTDIKVNEFLEKRKETIETVEEKINLSIDNYSQISNDDKVTFAIESDLKLCDYNLVKRFCYEKDEDILQEIVYNKTLPLRFLFLVYILNFRNRAFKEENIFEAKSIVNNININKMIDTIETHNITDVTKYIKNNFKIIDDEILFGYAMSNTKEVYYIRRIICELTENIDILDELSKNKDDVNILIIIIGKATKVKSFRDNPQYINILENIANYPNLDKKEDGDKLIRWLIDSYNIRKEVKDYLKDTYSNSINGTHIYHDYKDTSFSNHINIK